MKSTIALKNAFQVLQGADSDSDSDSDFAESLPSQDREDLADNEFDFNDESADIEFDFIDDLALIEVDLKDDLADIEFDFNDESDTDSIQGSSSEDDMSLDNLSEMELLSDLHMDLPKMPPSALPLYVEQGFPSLQVKKTFLDDSENMCDKWRHALQRSASTPASLFEQGSPINVETIDKWRQEAKVSKATKEVALNNTPLENLLVMMQSSSSLENSPAHIGVNDDKHKDKAVTNALIYDKDMCGHCGIASYGMACCIGQGDTLLKNSLEAEAATEATLCGDCGRLECRHGRKNNCTVKNCKYCHCRLLPPTKPAQKRPLRQQKKLSLAQ